MISVDSHWKKSLGGKQMLLKYTENSACVSCLLGPLPRISWHFCKTQLIVTTEK